MNHAVAYPLTIYYDAACPLCAREMHALAAFDGQARLRLIDCSVAGFADSATASAGLPQTALMRLIHACDANGRWYRGVDVFVLAYDAVGIEALARLWAHPRWRPLWDRAYPWIARHRMGVSRMRLSRPFGWLVAWLARRAQLRVAGCRDGVCVLTDAAELADAAALAPDRVEKTC